MRWTRRFSPSISTRLSLTFFVLRTKTAEPATRWSWFRLAHEVVADDHLARERSQLDRRHLLSPGAELPVEDVAASRLRSIRIAMTSIPDVPARMPSDRPCQPVEGRGEDYDQEGVVRRQCRKTATPPGASEGLGCRRREAERPGSSGGDRSPGSIGGLKPVARFLRAGSPTIASTSPSRPALVRPPGQPRPGPASPRRCTTPRGRARRAGHGRAPA